MPKPQKPVGKAKAVDPFETIDWLALWALSLAFCAMALAAIAYFSIGDKMGASFILTAAAGIIGGALYGSARSAHE